MGLKIYKIRCIGGEVTFPIEVNGERRYVTFKRRFGERLGSLSSDDVAVQRGIEGSSRFSNGEIEVEGGATLTEVDYVEPAVGDEAVISEEAVADCVEDVETSDVSVDNYDGVTRFSDARQILNKEFGIPYSRLSNSEMVRNEAKGVGVVFKNLGRK